VCAAWLDNDHVMTSIAANCFFILCIAALFSPMVQKIIGAVC
jgi:hypothetical protein